MLHSILDLLRDSQLPQGIAIYCDLAATDEIWMYERFPGKRLVIPWSGDFLPRSVSPQFLVQMDFVLGAAFLSAIVKESLSISGVSDAAPRNPR